LCKGGEPSPGVVLLVVEAAAELVAGPRVVLRAGGAQPEGLRVHPAPVVVLQEHAGVALGGGDVLPPLVVDHGIPAANREV